MTNEDVIELSAEASTNDKPSKKTILVPQGGNATFNFKLKPKTSGSWTLDYITPEKVWNISDLQVSFNENSTPAQCEVEFAILIVTMDDKSKAAGWIFDNNIHIYSEQLDANDSITKVLSADKLTWTFTITAKTQDSTHDTESIDYGYIATLNGIAYTQPDPGIGIGRP